MNTHQQTIQQSVTLKGIGLHSGQSVTLTFVPAPPHHGYKFQRIDLPGQPIIKADVNYVVDTQRSTTLANQNAKIRTVEHVLAALTGLQIDNILIQLDAEELPIMDGSAMPFLAVLRDAGIKKQEAKRQYFTLNETLFFYDEERDAEIIAIPHDGFEVTSMIDFNTQIFSPQHASLKQINDFEKEIAPARTFCFLHELKMLHKAGLIKGGSLNNALVIVDEKPPQDELEELAKWLEKPSVQVGDGQYLNNAPIRFTNEPARHKLLDIIGDFALAGMPLKAKIIASKPGHTSNVAFAKQLKALMLKNKRLLNMPSYDPKQPSVYNINQIMDLIPHRFPFLLVDKIVELTAEKVVAIKNVTYNEAFFQGHFPGHPVMPGVLIIEAMAQAGGVLLLNSVENPKDYVTYFLRMDKVKFRKPVVPGDTLLFQLTLASPIRRGLCEMNVAAYANEQLVTEGVLTAKMVKK